MSSSFMCDCSDWKTDCVWAISSLQNVALSLCECLLSTESGWRWEVASRNFVLIRIQENWVGEGIIRFRSQSPLNAKRRQSTFIPHSPRFPKQHCIYKVPTALLEWQKHNKTEVLKEKPVPVPPRPPQTSYELFSDHTRPSTVKGRRLAT
jgi:hypothetical protein